MLIRVMAPEGRGKTAYLLRRLAERAKEKKPIYLIVPEQITAETERAVLKLCGAPSNEYLEVCNFSRLSNLVMRKTGGVARRFLSPADKSVLLAACGRELESEFRVLTIKNLPDFAAEAGEALRDLAYAGASGAKLRELAESEELDERLRGKLADLHLLDAAYRASLEGRFDDPDEEMTHLANTLRRTPFFRGALVFVDAFWDFTAPETEVLREIMKQADDVFISFCCEKTGDDPLFSKGKRAAERLRSIAEQEGVEVRDPDGELSKEEAPGAIGYLKRFLQKQPPKDGRPPEDDGSVRLLACRNRFDEAHFVAGEICRLVREGYRYRDIAVLSRSGEEDELFGFVFDQAGIPHFSEKRTLLSESALAETIVHGAALARGDTRAEHLAAFLGNGILPVTEEERFLLKKYAVTWSLSGRAFLDPAPFTLNPEGFVQEDHRKEAEKAAQEAELNAVNAAREAVFRPVRRLAGALSAPAVREKVTAVVDFLKNLKVEETVLARAAARREAGRFEEAGVILRNWNLVLERLGSLAASAGEREISSEAFAELLLLAFSGEEAGAVPPSQDLVMLGALPFTRQRARAVFVTGLNAGVFPPDASRGGILTARDREELTEKEIAFPKRSDEQAEEFFLFYLALSFAKEKLTVTFRSEKSAIEDNLSVIGHRVRALLGGKDAAIPVFDPDGAIPENRESAFRFLLTHQGDGEADVAYLRSVFAGKEGYAERLLDAAGGRAYARSGMALEKHLPPQGNMGSSYSRLEQYSLCPYRYFAQYLLNARKVKKARFDASNAGTFVHAVLEAALRRAEKDGRGIESYSRGELEAINDEICSALLTEQIRGAADKRTLAITQRLKRSTLLLLLMLKEEFTDCRFRPIFTEKELSDLGGGYRIDLKDGTHLTIFGSIDRVDHYRAEDGRDYVRVVDYKTKEHAFSLERVANGIDLQMLIYLFALCRSGFEYGGRTIRPEAAGVIYSNGLFEPMRCKGREEGEKVVQGKKSPFSHTGLLLDNPAILDAQNARFLPVYVTSKGRKEGVLATAEEFGALRERIENELIRLTGNIKAGVVEPLPLRTDEEENPEVDACKWCDFLPMCKNDPDHIRSFCRMTREEIFPEEVPNG